MKRNLLLMIVIIISSLCYGQTERIVLLEQFTGASCGWCAVYNPDVQVILDANPDKITAIKYQWYAPDPMYDHNKDDVNARVSMYGISGAPSSVLDGNYFNGHPANWDLTNVETRRETNSPCEIIINQELIEDNSKIKATMIVNASEDINASNLKAFIVVVEKEIIFSSPPGSNGEKEFYNVMKKFLPTINGSDLPDVIEAGDYVILQEEWVIENAYDVNELSIVGFVQDMDTKEIHQAAMTIEEPIDLPYNVDAEVVSISNITESNCYGKVDPFIVLRNNGNNNLTSCTISYNVHNENPSTYEWTGNLASLESSVVELPSHNFTPGDENTVTITITNANTQVDEFSKNNSLSYSFSSAIIASDKVMIFMRTDNDPEETTWEVTDINGDLIEAGGPYTEANTIIMDTIFIAETGCYEFALYDAGGNGINNGNGNFVLYHGTNTTILSAQDFGSKASDQFSIDNGVGISEPVINENISLYPNPSQGDINLTISSSNSNTAHISIYSTIGANVYENNYKLSQGENQLNINNAQLSEGIYLVKVKVGNNIYSERLSIVK